MAKKQTNKLDGVSDAAAQRATGRGWDEWISILDEAEAKDWNHKEIVAFLKQNYDLPGWWQQTVTVAYEKAKGRRVVGQTADTGYQVGVQKTLPIGIEDAWALLTSRKGITCWLGKVSRFSLTEGRTYKTETEIAGEIRVVKPGNRVRLTWQMPEMKRSATLQIALVESGPHKTSLRVHLENLPSQKFRAKMKSNWRTVLDALAQLAVTS